MKCKLIVEFTNDSTEYIIRTRGINANCIHLVEHYGSPMINMGDSYVNIHLISCSEISEHDWVYSPKGFPVVQEASHWLKSNKLNGWNKIVATTNSDLKSNDRRLPQIPRDFINIFIRQYNVNHVLEYTLNVATISQRDLNGNEISGRDVVVDYANEVLVCGFYHTKEMYSKPEVEWLCKKAYSDGFYSAGTDSPVVDSTSWIEDNL